MPTLPSFLRPRPRSPPPPSPITTYYLTTPYSSNQQALRSIPSSSHPSEIPSGSLIFSFTHPQLSISKGTSFFLDCIPDPIGFLYHSSFFISKHLSPNNEQGKIEWRHQLIQLELENKDGLAATSGGKIVISLKWIENIMNQVKRNEKSKQSAIKEFKGVLLHELVHTIQHDGFGSTPGWLIESIADYVRLLGKLGPDHWRKSGSGKIEKGYEDGYDIGARFLVWLTTNDPEILDDTSRISYDGGELIPVEYAIQPSQTPTSTATSNDAKPTQYPDPNWNQGYIENHSLNKSKPKHRPGPYPDLIKLIDSRLKFERWDDSWWQEMTGLNLDDLWSSYMAYYGRF
ncbi:uncharacterized protein L201_001495 [Kwoniella dendrophila CBS 6074]|uniref:SprT-like domain-containing protein n=1 Tax=Kwoniella dendrophila CBS 6074 TaxID=1295534 RepID=A0AAX4JP15_9TREE